jgi:hypothetical protein
MFTVVSIHLNFPQTEQGTQYALNMEDSNLRRGSLKNK